jgi:hypothetical protein
LATCCLTPLVLTLLYSLSVANTETHLRAISSIWNLFGQCKGRLECWGLKSPGSIPKQMMNGNSACILYFLSLLWESSEMCSTTQSFSSRIELPLVHSGILLTNVPVLATSPAQCHCATSFVVFLSSPPNKLMSTLVSGSASGKLQNNRNLLLKELGYEPT